ncbi:MAG: inositol monophosphatase family protein [Sulfuricella sp.]|nr:inositol monophosphatase family protein [Sulfuricella sp.]
MLQSVLSTIKSVALAEIMPRYLKVARQQKSDGSLFTEADVASQAALVTGLQAVLDCPVLGEEMSVTEQEALWKEAGQSGLWCIDPIDGTSNFVNGLPYFAVSVGLVRGGRSVLGAVYDPVSDEMFYAEQGRGAFLNGVRLPIKAHVPAFHHTMAAVDLKRLSRELARDIAAAPPFSSQRNFGASALDWCYTAAGRFDLYLHGGQKLWDYVAGALILEEAGGALCTLTCDDFWSDDLWKRSVIAALDPGLFAQWKAWVRGRIE